MPMQFINKSPNWDLAELEQDRPCRFTFGYVKDNTVTAHAPFVLCRDFLNDTLVWKTKENKLPKGEDVFGWKCRGKYVQTHWTSLLMSDIGNLKENIRFLNHLIADMPAPHLLSTEVMETTDPRIFWVIGDKFWQTTTVHMSWYTTMLRMLTVDETVTSPEDLTFQSPFCKMVGIREIFMKLPYVLSKLEFKGVMGAKDPPHNECMHDNNGWFTAVDENKYKFNVYGEELRGLLRT